MENKTASEFLKLKFKDNEKWNYRDYESHKARRPDRIKFIEECLNEYAQQQLKAKQEEIEVWKGNYTMLLEKRKEEFREYLTELTQTKEQIESQQKEIEGLRKGLEFMRLNFLDIKRHDVDMTYYIKYIESLLTPHTEAKEEGANVSNKQQPPQQ